MAEQLKAEGNTLFAKQKYIAAIEVREAARVHVASSSTGAWLLYRSPSVLQKYTEAITLNPQLSGAPCGLPGLAIDRLSTWPGAAAVMHRSRWQSPISNEIMIGSYKLTARSMDLAAALYVNRAMCNKKRGDWERVVDDCKQALSLNRDYMKVGAWHWPALRLNIMSQCGSPANHLAAMLTPSCSYVRQAIECNMSAV